MNTNFSQSSAYELADKLETTIKLGYPSKMESEEVINMLRQQADRIAELEKLISEMKYEKSNGVYEKQTKPLTNDEIREIGDECELKNNGRINWIQFARAIEAKVRGEK